MHLFGKGIFQPTLPVIRVLEQMERGWTRKRRIVKPWDTLHTSPSPWEGIGAVDLGTVPGLVGRREADAVCITILDHQHV